MKVSCYESKRFVSSPLRWFKEAATFRPSPSHLPSQKKPNSTGKILASTNFIYSLYKVLSLTNSRMLNFATTFCKRLNVKELVTNVPVYGSIADGSAGGLSLMFRRWATKKTAGSTKNGRDSKPKNLGVKKFGGERVIPGNIIVRQRGTRFHPGDYVGIGKDHTLYALKEGRVKFEKHKLSGRKWVHVEPKEGHVLHPLYASDSSTQLEMAT